VSIAPISPVEQPMAPSAAASVPRGRELLFALLVAVVVFGLGAPFGLLWSKLAPHVELVQTQYGPYPIEGEPEGYWADDGYFLLMSIAMGIVIAVAAWFLLRRYRGPILLAALVIGSAAASVLAAWLGNKIGWSHYVDQVNHAPVDTHIFRPVKLRTGTSSLYMGFIPWVRGTMLVQALSAAAVYTGLAGFHASPTLRYDNMPAEYLDPQFRPPAEGQAGLGQDPQAAPYPPALNGAYAPTDSQGAQPWPAGPDGAQHAPAGSGGGHPGFAGPDGAQHAPAGSDGGHPGSAGPDGAQPTLSGSFDGQPSAAGPNGAQPAAAGSSDDHHPITRGVPGTTGGWPSAAANPTHAAAGWPSANPESATKPEPPSAEAPRG
jgi:hypothetical protein